MNKAEFLETLRSERERWKALLARANETQMSQPGVAGDWSLKDIIAHVTAYERGLVQWLQAAQRGELLELPDLDNPDLEARNALIYARNQNRSLRDVLAESEQIFAQLLAMVEDLSEDQLADPAQTDWFVVPRWRKSQPLWLCIADDSYRHYQQHVPDIQAWLDSIEEYERTGTPYTLSDAAKARMLRKLLFYWDGQWFLKTTETYGLEEAIDLNARVRESFGRIEMRTLLKTLGKQQADDLPDAIRLLDTYGQAFMGGMLRAEFRATGARHAEIIVRRCAAYEGAKRAALPRTDQACVACAGLWSAWLEVLLPGTAVSVRHPQRQGMGDPQCRFVIELQGTERQDPEVD